MMKDVTILTFDEMERIRHDLEHMHYLAVEGENGSLNPKTACDCIALEIEELQKRLNGCEEE